MADKKLIPINPEYELFFHGFIGVDGDLLNYDICNAVDHIKRLVNENNHDEAALRAMQLTKSLCRHFVADEHWKYFDDIYSPDLTISCLLKYFNDLQSDGKLDVDAAIYLHEAWPEITQEEGYYNYGVPSTDINF